VLCGVNVAPCEKWKKATLRFDSIEEKNTFYFDRKRKNTNTKKQERKKYSRTQET